MWRDDEDAKNLPRKGKERILFSKFLIVMVLFVPVLLSLPSFRLKYFCSSNGL